MSSPPEKYLALIQAGERVEPSTRSTIFDQLPPITPDTLIGEWNGGFLDTGHPVAETLGKIK